MNSHRQPHKVCIGMPVFNGEEFVRQSVESILDQDYSDFEIIIGDNCSSDATETICKELARCDPRVRYVRNEWNFGAPENYNRVFRLSNGEYFKWSSCSDLCGPGVLSACVQRLNSDPGAVLAYPQTRLFSSDPSESVDYDDDMNLNDPSPYRRFIAVLDRLRLNNIFNGVIRRSALAKTGLNQTYFYSDKVLFAELALRGEFSQVDGVHFYRRMSAATTASQRDPAALLNHWVPGRTTAMRYQRWHYMIGLIHALARAHPGIVDTVHGMSSVVQRMIWNRRDLLDELVHPATSDR